MRHLITSLFILAFSWSYAQLDSASIVSVDYIASAVTDSTGATVTDSTLQIEIYVNDFDFLGEVLLTITDSPSDYPLAKFRMDRAEIESSGLYDDSSQTITFLFQGVYSANSLNIRAVISNYQGAYLPYLDTLYTH